MSQKIGEIPIKKENFDIWLSILRIYDRKNSYQKFLFWRVLVPFSGSGLCISASFDANHNLKNWRNFYEKMENF